MLRKVRRSTSPAAVLSAFAFAFVGVACSLLVDSNGLTGGVSPTTTTTTSLDGSIDGVASSSDGSAPALDGGDDAGFKGCAALDPAPKFCKDFDDGKPLDADWDAVITDVANGQLVGFDTNVFFSSPQSAKMTTTKPGDCQYARFERYWKTAHVEKQVSLQMRVRPSSPWRGNTTVVDVVLSDPAHVGQFCQVLFDFNSSDGTTLSGGINIQRFDGTNFIDDFHSLTGPPPTVDAWNDFAMTVQQGFGAPLLNATLNGQPALTTAVGECAFGSGVELYVGIHCSPLAAEMHADDVVFDFN